MSSLEMTEDTHLSQLASRLAEQLSSAFQPSLLGESEDLPLSGEALQKLFAVLVKIYASKLESGERLHPFGDTEVTATEVMRTVTQMLKAVQVDLFELGMWQSWT
ncbi:MAG: hypothetical protein K6T31_01870 [Alicyclobacillus sp.]|nr:hypothetical protein [Alicyclobacillus sp.]